jgi:argininosuccinate lyase
MLWGGRFSEVPSAGTLEFNSAENIRLDRVLIPYDILGSLAHVRMLCSQGILTVAEHRSISAALKASYCDWKKGRFSLKPELEDVHMNVETAVTSVTAAGKKMHTARSRNDQVLLDMRLYLRDEALSILSSISSLQSALAALSKKDGPMVAYTHTRIAQPITVSFWCEGWVRSFDRDMERIISAYSRINQNPLGACAVAGTSWKINRDETAKLLAFNSVQENELDAISSRGECETELLSVLSVIMCKLSRMSGELIWLSEKGLVMLSEKHTTGSSIMPNKKNPDVLELVRGRAGRVYGNLSHCLVALKGLPSGYNSDMQETKYAVMEGIATTAASLAAMKEVVSGISFDEKKVHEELDRGFAQATGIADYLAMHGVPFREAHEKSGRLVKYCEKKHVTLPMLGSEEASKVLGIAIPASAWKLLIGHWRQRLKRNVKPGRAAPDFVKKERKKIETAYQELLVA